MTWLELQSSDPFSILNVSSVSLLLECEVSFTDLHTSQERPHPTPLPPPPPPHGLDLPSASTLGNAAGTRWSLRLLSFLKPIIGTSVKVALWGKSGVSKKCNSAKIFYKFWKTGKQVRLKVVLFCSSLVFSLSSRESLEKTSCPQNLFLNLSFTVISF